jgi:hypothetical protein
MRLGLRTLVVAGFAGAAWLLSSSAAHAAEASTTDSDGEGLSVVNLVGDLGNEVLGEGTGKHGTADDAGSASGAQGGATEPVLGATSILLSGVLTDSDQAGSVVHNGTAASQGPAAAVRRACSSAVASRPGPRTCRVKAGTSSSDGRHSVGATSAPVDAAQRSNARDAGNDAGRGGLLGLVHGLVTPLGLADVVATPVALLAPLTDVLDPVVAPVITFLRPVTDTLRTAADPVTSALRSVTRAVTGDVDRTTNEQRGIPVLGLFGSGSITSLSGRFGPMVAAVADPTGVAATGQHHVSGARLDAGPEVRPAVLSAGSPGTDVPTRPLSMPMPAYVGLGGGSSTSGSHSPSDGGGFAVVSSSVANSAVASHRLPAAADVAVLRLAAEDPTVSPD